MFEIADGTFPQNNKDNIPQSCVCAQYTPDATLHVALLQTPCQVTRRHPYYGTQHIHSDRTKERTKFGEYNNTQTAVRATTIKYSNVNSTSNVFSTTHPPPSDAASSRPLSISRGIAGNPLAPPPASAVENADVLPAVPASAEYASEDVRRDSASLRT